MNSSPFKQVASPADVLSQLQSISPVELERKLKLMHEYGTRFAFMQKITDPPNAINSLLAGMCMKQTRFPPLPASAEQTAARKLESW